ncbi:MAG: hypothetical protein EXQ90_07255 [Rhodospirillales bacterium]|nr:hypothetical protein [Rhodospirillales bacterium]
MPDYLMATKTIGYGDLPGFRFFAGLSTGAFLSLAPRSREDGERLGKKLAESVALAPELVDLAFGVPLAMQFEVADLSLIDRVGSRGGFTCLAATGTSSGLVDGMGALALTVNLEGIALPSSVADPAFVQRQARLAIELYRVPVRQALVKAAGSFGAVRSLALSDDGAFRVHTPEIAAWLLGETRTIVAAAGTEIALSDLTLANPTYRIGIKGAARAAPQARMLFSGEVTVEAEGLDAVQGAIERSPQTAAFVDVFAALRAVGTRDGATVGRSRHVYRLSLADDGRFTVNDKDVMALGATLGDPSPSPCSDRPRTGGAVRSEAIEQPLAAPGRPSVQRETLGI